MEENVPDGSICCICQSSDNDEALYGKFYKYQDIITHYFCLLLASKILQRGSDEDGILGFLPNDIINEIKRGKNLVCCFCGKRGATIGCFSPKCRLNFHLPCGRKRDTFHQFFGQFKSFCPKHRLKQKINHQVLKAMSGRKSVNCVICLESVSTTPAPNTLWAPCCSKEAWFHRLCVQRLALSAGYFFKCPLCNNTKQFVEAMRTYGIWVPEQDASWEAEPERYSSLLERHSTCDAKSCRCRQGRSFHLDNTRWEIKLCVDCGSQGMHVQCGNLRVNDDWVCPVCSSVTVQKENLQTNRGSQDRLSIQNSSRRTSRRDQHVISRIATRLSQASEESGDGEDEEVDVVGSTNEEEDNLREQFSGLQKSKLNDPAPQTPSPNVSIAKKSSSRSRSSKRRARSKRSRKDTVSTTQTAMEKENFEIIDIDDNSDDDVQCVRSRGKNVLCSRKREPPACSCNGRHSFRNYASSSNNRRTKQEYLHHGKFFTKPYGSELITKFFSELAMQEASKRPLKEVYCNIMFPNTSVVQACPISCVVRNRAGVKSVLSSCRKKNKIIGAPNESSVGECSLSSSKKGEESCEVSPYVKETPVVSTSKRKRRTSDSGTNLNFDKCRVGAKKRRVQKRNQTVNNPEEISSDTSNMLRSYYLFGKNTEHQGTKKLSDLAKLPSFQPIIVLNKITDEKIERTSACRKRSVSSGRRPSVQHMPTQERKSRRDIFLEGKKMNCQRKMHSLRSPVITRSRSRNHIPETSGRRIQYRRHRKISSSPSPVSSRSRKIQQTSCLRRYHVQTRSHSQSKCGEILEKPKEKLVRKGSKTARSGVPLLTKKKLERSSYKSDQRLSPVVTRSRSSCNRSLSRKKITSCCEVKDLNNSAQVNTLENQSQSIFENPVLSQYDVSIDTNASSPSDFPNTWKKLMTYEDFPLVFNPENISSSDETDDEINVPEKRLIAVIGSILNKATNSDAGEELYVSEEEEDEEGDELEEDDKEEEKIINYLSKVYHSQNTYLVPPEETSDTDESNDSRSTENLPPNTSLALLQSSSLLCSSASSSKSSGLKLMEQSCSLPSSKSLLYLSNYEEDRVPSELQSVSQSVTCFVPQQISEQSIPSVNTTNETTEAEHGIGSYNLPIPHSLLTPSTSLNDITPNRSPKESCARLSQFQSVLEFVSGSDAQQISKQPKPLMNIPMQSSDVAQQDSCNLPMSHSLLTPSTSFSDTTSNNLSVGLSEPTQSSMNDPLEYFHHKPHSTNGPSITTSGSSNIMSSASEAINPLPRCHSMCDASLISNGPSGSGPRESPTIRSRLRSRSGSPGICKTSSIRSRLRSRSGSPGASKSSIIHSRLRGRSRSSETRNSTGRKLVSEYPSPVWTGIPSESKHRQVRSVNAISKECRIKALALTARKFVPVSRIASEQRQMILRLQELRQRQDLRNS